MCALISIGTGPRSMTLDDLEFYKFQRISRDFADFGRNNS